MINSVQEIALTLASNSANIPFSTDVVRTRSANCVCNGWLNHSTGSTQYQITEPGIYEILFNTNVTSATVGQTALSIKANGETLSGTEMDYTIATANVYSSVSANRLIRVCGNGSTTITVGSVATVGGTDTQIPIVKNSSLIIKKIA
jgi:hypothetical protein